MDYTTQMKEAEISVSDYVDRYVRAKEFIEYCRQCPNYGRIWSCPEYDFDTEEYFRKFSTLRVIGLKIIYSPEMREKTLSREELREVIAGSLRVERKKLDEYLRGLEEETGGTALNAGSCTLCPEGCARPDGESCRFPGRMRYSLESLGADITATIGDLLGIDLIWDSEGKLPEYYTLVAGLLYD
ncbi:MAG: metal-binding protein [Eubacteriaceae bacterium]|nr:metal-binding protein [Eubacteriaceae bacterium]